MHNPTKLLRFALPVALLLFAAPTFAQFFPNAGYQPPAPAQITEATAAKTLLDQAAAFQANDQLQEAIDSVRRVIDTYGTGIVERKEAASLGYEVYSSVASATRARVIDWSREKPEVLEAYRARVDALADAWYRQAIAERDEALLDRLLDQAFLSSVADDALLAAGDAALRRGDYATARRHYMRIATEFFTPKSDSELLLAGPGSPVWMALRGIDWEQDRETVRSLLVDSPPAEVLGVYPDADVDLGGVWLRMIMVSLLAGDVERAEVERQLLATLHTDGEGSFGGKQGKYIELAAELLASASDWPQPPLPLDWTMLAGNPARTGRQVGEIDLAGPPRWTFPLAPINGQSDQLGSGRPRVAERFEKLLSTHVIVVDDLVIFNDLQHVYAISLASGRPAWRQVADDAKPEALREAAVVHRPGADQPPAILPDNQHIGVPRFTLTEHGNQVFTRMGAPVTHNLANNDRSPRGYLVGIDLASQGKMLTGFPLTVESDRWAFEGAPLLVNGKLLVAMRHSQAQSQAYVACFDALGGKQLWRTRICSSQPLSAGSLPVISQNLLTVAGDRVYYNTNHGAVAALAIDTGSLAWITRYPRAVKPASRTPNVLYQFRDLNPCVVAGDLVVVAPSDCDRVFALDATSGMLMWETVPELAADAIHLLGVSGGNLILSGERLYWIDLMSGKVVGQFPNSGNLGDGLARPSPRGYGRGLIASGVIYWPTERHIYKFDAAIDYTGNSPRVNMLGKIDLIRHGAPGGGNLVLAGGMLVIATGDQLVAFEAVGTSEKRPDVEP